MEPSFTITRGDISFVTSAIFLKWLRLLVTYPRITLSFFLLNGILIWLGMKILEKILSLPWKLGLPCDIVLAHEM